MEFRTRILTAFALPCAAMLCVAAGVVLLPSGGQAEQFHLDSAGRAVASHRVARHVEGPKPITVFPLARAGHPHRVLVLYGPRIESQAVLQAPLPDSPEPLPRRNIVALRSVSHFGYEDTLREALAGGYTGALLDTAASDVPPPAFVPGPAFAPPQTAGNVVPAAYTLAPCPLVIAVGPGTRHAPKTRIVSGQPACS